MAINRIEVFLDGSAEPIQVLTSGPFKVSYDTTKIPDGDHALKVVTYYENGSTDIKEIPFKVANTPGVLIQGIKEGKEVSGNLDLTLRVADNYVKPVNKTPGLAMALATAAILGGIWLFFAATGATNKAVEEAAVKPVTETASAGGHEAEFDKALFAKGEATFANCAGCHGSNGEGVVGPKFAGSPALKDVKAMATILIKGKGGMPALGGSLSDEEVAGVLTYVRNSFGNNFGGVSVAEAKAAR